MGDRASGVDGRLVFWEALQSIGFLGWMKSGAIVHEVYMFSDKIACVVLFNQDKLLSLRERYTELVGVSA